MDKVGDPQTSELIMNGVQERPIDLTITEHVHRVQADGCEIPVHFARPRNPHDARYTALFVPHKFGMDRHARQVARGLARRGTIVATPDLMARFGGSRPPEQTNHTPTARGLPREWHEQDVLNVAEHVTTTIDGDFPLVIVGESFGCDLAVAITRRPDTAFDGLVTFYGDAGSAGASTRVLAVFASDTAQTRRAAATRTSLRDHPDATVMTIPDTARGFLDRQRDPEFDPAATDRVLDFVRKWLGPGQQ